MRCKIYDMNNEGEGIAKISDIVTFIPYSIVDDIIDIDIVEKKKSYYYGKINKIITPSFNRNEPLCPYYYKCGGCNLMHMMYDEELNYKKNKVINNLKHISNIDVDNIEIVSDNNFNYRNHITLEVNNNVVGFYKYHTTDVVDINSCIVANDLINYKIKEIKKFLNLYQNNNIKRISIKAYDEILINIVSDNFKLIDEFKRLVPCDSLFLNDKLLSGKKSVLLTFDKYKFNISSKSFFQKNNKIAIKLYDYIKENVTLNDKVLDLYSGIGSIGIYISDKAKKVISIEIEPEANSNAKENAKLNNIKNISFVCGKTEDNLNNIKNIDTIIVDPPRVGLNRKAINDILKINSKKIIYVSCNSTTLSRDLNYLKENYNITKVKLFDMFPNTHHVESVCVLERKN